MTDRRSRLLEPRRGRDLDRWVVRGEQGSVLLLLLGLVVLSALLVTVVLDVSALFLARRDLLAAADGAALAGAQSVDEAAVYRQGVHGSLPLDPQGARVSVDAYLRTAAGSTASLRDLSWQVVSDGTEVQVVVSSRLQLPLVGSVVEALADPDGVVVTASATARSAVLP